MIAIDISVQKTNAWDASPPRSYWRQPHRGPYTVGLDLGGSATKDGRERQLYQIKLELAERHLSSRPKMLKALDGNRR